MASYDVIVVGAGISGAAAAYFLGEAGYEVLVLEKERIPRYKPCAGGVPKSVFRHFPFSFNEVIERQIAAVRYSFRGEREAIIPLPQRPIAMVMRDKLDAFVLEHARALVREGTKVVDVDESEKGVQVMTDDGQEFVARYLIGADGANSLVAGKLGLRRNKALGVALEAEVRVDELTLTRYADTALFEFGAVKKGYLWIFPKRDHLSVGIGVFAKGKADLRGILRREMARFGIEMSGAILHAHPLPIHLRAERLHTACSLLIGDAAGLVDPLLGEGIRHAVASARLAVEAIREGNLSGYTRRVQSQIGANLRVGSKLALIFYGLPRLSFSLAVCKPAATRAFLKIFEGRMGYTDLLRHVPKYLVGLIGGKA